MAKFGLFKGINTTPTQVIEGERVHYDIVKHIMSEP